MTACPPPADACCAFDDLNAQGLNLQAVFNLVDLPADVQAALPVDSSGPYRQLLLIGHLGGLLWRQLTLAGMAGEHPIDTFTRTQVTAWLQRQPSGMRYHWVYPGPTAIGLQRLGQLAGWHHPSPFMVGVNADWGSWFAYRAVVLADTCLTPTLAQAGASPCDECTGQPCVGHCPAGALHGGQPGSGYDLLACLTYRRLPDSACQDRCLARNSCPVGQAYRYSDAQISYHYGRSMAAALAIRSREG